jgi:hypothetical protein
MKSKPLDKSTAEKIEKSLTEITLDEIRDTLHPRRKTLGDRWEDLIEDTWVEDSYYWCYRKFKFGYWNPRTAYRIVSAGVKNLIKWFPIIWNDRDWDWHYWLTMNIKKLEGMEKSIRNGHHLYGWRDADNIRKALLALKRLEDDDYHDNAFKNHDAKWGKMVTSWGVRDERGSTEMFFNRPNANTDEEKALERKEFGRCIKHMDYMQKQDIEYANGIITKYLFHWWD